MRKAYERLGVAVLDLSTLPEGMKQADYMRICIAMLQSADAVQLLPGWEENEGAILEKDYAVMIGLNVYLPIYWEGGDQT